MVKNTFNERVLTIVKDQSSIERRKKKNEGTRRAPFVLDAEKNLLIDGCRDSFRQSCLDFLALNTREPDSIVRLVGFYFTDFNQFS